MKLNANTSIPMLANLLLSLKGQKVAILRHKQPDGDAIASSFALAYALNSIGAFARVLNTDPVPEGYRYITDTISEADFAEDESEYFIAVDTPKAARLGKYADARLNCVIDHHEKNGLDCEYRYVEEDASSCSEIILKLIREMGIGIDAVIARLVCIGILTDTKGLTTISVNADTIKALADVSDFTDAGEVMRRHCFYKSLNRIAAEGSLMASMRHSSGGRVLGGMLSYEDFVRSAVKKDELEGINALFDAVEGHDLAVVVREETKGHCRVSIRAGAGYNASEICAYYGGGGHANAAGCELDGSAAEVLKTMEEACGRYLAR